MNAHKLKMEGPPGALSQWKCWCTCGKWGSAMPAIGSWGRTSAKARCARVRMAHAAHVKHAIRKEMSGG